MPPATVLALHTTPAGPAASDVISPPACSAVTSTTPVPPTFGAVMIWLSSAHMTAAALVATRCGSVISLGSLRSSATTFEAPAADTFATKPPVPGNATAYAKLPSAPVTGACTVLQGGSAHS